MFSKLILICFLVLSIQVNGQIQIKPDYIERDLKIYTYEYEYGLFDTTTFNKYFFRYSSNNKNLYSIEVDDFSQIKKIKKYHENGIIRYEHQLIDTSIHSRIENVYIKTFYPDESLRLVQVTDYNFPSYLNGDFCVNEHYFALDSVLIQSAILFGKDTLSGTFFTGKASTGTIYSNSIYGNNGASLIINNGLIQPVINHFEKLYDKKK